MLSSMLIYIYSVFFGMIVYFYVADWLLEREIERIENKFDSGLTLNNWKEFYEYL